MKRIKIVLLAVALLLSGGLFAQINVDLSQNITIEGKAGKQIIFKAIPNMPSVAISRNGKFLMGQDEEGKLGFIYEIATERIQMFNSSVIEVVDWDNYVTSSFAIIEGEEYDRFMDLAVDTSKDFAIVEASADLLTLRASLYVTRKGADFGNVLIETKTGKIIDTLAELDPTYPDGGKMNMGLAMSNDAKIIAGRASLSNTFTNFTPAFWDLNRDEVTFTGYTYIDNSGRELNSSGQLFDIKGSGTAMCGEIRDRACYVEYDRGTGKFEVSYIDPFPGYDNSVAFKMNEKGMLLGTDQIGTDPDTRRPFIYLAESKQKYVWADYLKNLYGLDAEQEMSLFTPIGISDDGRVMTGYNGMDGAWYAYVILLDEHQIYAPARNVQVRNFPRNSSNVVVSWQEPLPGEYTLTGYNVYRDQEKVNQELIAFDKLSFTDENVENGRHKYFVQAVYGDKESDATDTANILVMGADGCLPVQELFSSVEYNRTVNLSWGLPTAQANQNVINYPPKGKPAPKYAAQNGLDFVSVFQPAITYVSASVRIGDYVYSGNFYSGNILVCDALGNVLKDVRVDGLPSVYDMTYRDGTFYVVSAGEQVQMLDLNPNDPFDITRSSYFSTSMSRAANITYVENDDETVNNGEDYLLVGDYYHFVGYPLSAVDYEDEFELPVKFDLTGMVVGGCEYYKGRLYVSDQTGTNGCDVVAFDMATGEKLHTTDLYAMPTVLEASTGGPEPMYAGGLTHATLEDGTVVLEFLVQCAYTYNMMVDLELESSDDVLGYVVWRNGKAITDTLKARHFSENIDEPGTYTYEIQYLSMRGCESKSSMMDVTRTVVIYEKGECNAPKGLRAYESNKQAVLSWTNEGIDDGILVGFNLYRNGEQIGEKNFLRLDYTDPDVELGVKYQYRLEAFYDNSCTASDTVEITLDGKGAAREPSAFHVEGEETEDNSTIKATATWGLPYFEEPMAYGYCGLPAGADNVTNTSQLFCIIGWDESDMDKFDEDLYLVGVEFIVNTTRLLTLSPVVYVDGNLVYNKLYTDRYQAREWTRVYFDQAFKMKQEHMIDVGYAASYDASQLTNGEAVFVYDAGPRTPRKSDQISIDGIEFTTLYGAFGIDVNLCINALVVRLRDLEAAASASDPQAYLATKVMREDMTNMRLAGEKPLNDAPKTSSEGIKLLGFNIYREGEKLNENMLTDFSYEENVARGDYSYEVGAVYEGADEQKAEFFAQFETLGVDDLQKAYGVSVYPNPATDRLNIKGEYVSFSLLDVNGRVLMREVKNTESVSLAGLNNGVYFVMMTLPNGDKRAVKIIKR